MEGEAHLGTGVFQYPAGQHGLGSGEALLVRLKHQLHGALQFALVVPEQSGGAQKHGGMHIVAAGVHIAVVRLKGQVRFVTHPQGVHIGPEQDTFAGILSRDRGNDTALADFPGRIAHLREPPLHIFRGGRDRLPTSGVW